MPSSSHPAAPIAAAASIAAGLIHAAAAGSHAEMATLSALFAVTALAQIGWGAAVLVRPTQPVVIAGLGIHLAAFGAWLTSRTVGLSAVEGLEAGQSIGFQDGLAAGLALLALAAATTVVADVAMPRLGQAAVPAVVALLAFATVPAMAQPHDHAAHDHDDGVALAAGAGASTGGDHHDDGHAHDESHDHGDAGHDDAHGHDGEQVDSEPELTKAELGYPPSFVPFLDEAPSPAARARAELLLIETTEAMEAFPDEAAVQAAGFTSIGDGGTGWEHYIHIGRIVDPRVLDPEDIESIVLKVNPDGTKEVASAMYLLPFGTTMADAPDVAGELAPWHDHQDLCWDGARVVGRTDADGNCARGEFRPTQPMLHVWVDEHPCGPFAGIEGSHGSGCEHDH
jgi:hypothetical protein